MQILTKAILDGKLTGQEVWICDLRYENYSEKPIRKVKPTLVTVRNNSELPKGTNIYYSDYHFAIKGKDGKFKNTIIKLFDNTGFRSFPGTPLMIFDNEQECRDYYEDRIAVVRAEFDEYLNKLKSDFYSINFYS